MPARTPSKTTENPKPDLNNFVAVGWDQSVNHGAIVAINREGQLLDWRWYAQAVKDCKDKQRSAAFSSDIRNEKNRDLKAVYRLGWIDGWCEGALIWLRHLINSGHHAGAVIGLEDYAMAASQGAHQIGEVSGVVRLRLYRNRFCYVRLWDPLTLKLYATGCGDADKDSIRNAIRERWGVEFPGSGSHEDDLMDAYALARMTLLEADVRTGRVSLQHLLDQERRIFLRVTKSHPINVLERPYLCIP